MARVLIADDDRAIRETIEMVLTEAGHHVTLANDGAAALEILRTTDQPHIVILDHLMPRLDGFGVLRAVAATPALIHLHGYLLVSASPRQLNEEERALLAAVQASVLPKPFDIDDLIATVDRLAHRHASAQPLLAPPEP